MLGFAMLNPTYRASLGQNYDRRQLNLPAATIIGQGHGMALPFFYLWTSGGCILFCWVSGSQAGAWEPAKSLGTSRKSWSLGTSREPTEGGLLWGCLMRGETGEEHGKNKAPHVRG